MKWVLAAGLLVSGCLSATAQTASLHPERLRVERLTEPLATDSGQPLLSWALAAAPAERGVLQTSYEIQAASALEKLAANAPDLWDSHQVPSQEPGFCRYGGSPLGSGQRVYWRVRVWDQAHQPGAWSQPDWFETGLLQPLDWTGPWIGLAQATRGEAAPYLRGTLVLTKPVVSARAYICGLGWNELYVNGSRIGDHVLDAAQTDYNKRCLYVAHDITQAVQRSARPGKVAIGVILGDGWYNDTRAWGGAMAYGQPRLRAEFVFTHPDGSQTRVASDDSWKAKTGPILASNVYAGETYDARKDLGDWSSLSASVNDWNPVATFPPPGGELVPQTIPPIRRLREIPTKDFKEITPGTWVYNFGENVAGWERLHIVAESGTTIHLRLTEKVGPNGDVDPSTEGAGATGVDQEDTYIASGAAQGETWEPRFTYHGFQYAELTVTSGKLLQPPAPQTLTSIVLHTDVEPAGEFTCSDPLLNRLHEVARRTMLANILGVPTDCPVRERCGWTGDAHTVSEYEMLNFDEAGFFQKYLRDVQTGANPAGAFLTYGNGFSAKAVTIAVPAGIPNMIAPGKRLCQMASPDWGSATVFLPWRLYSFTGDRSVLTEFRGSMETWTDYLLSQRHPDGMLYLGLGDWCSPSMGRDLSQWIGTREVPLTSTAMLIRCLTLLGRIESLLGHPQQAAHYQQLQKQETEKWLALFFRDGDLAQRSQTALAFGISLVPDPVRKARLFAALLQKVDQGRNFATGILGTPLVLQELSDAGHTDLACRLLTKPELPSFRAEIDLGATTLWENWPSTYASYTSSMSHPMQGGYDAWLYEDIAGVGARASGTSPWQFRCRPDSGLASAQGTYRSNLGLLKSSWANQNGTVTWHVAVPAGAQGELSFPHLGPGALGQITESGQPLSGSHPGWLLQQSLVQNGLSTRQVLKIGSGDYTFSFPFVPVSHGP